MARELMFIKSTIKKNLTLYNTCFEVFFVFFIHSKSDLLKAFAIYLKVMFQHYSAFPSNRFPIFSKFNSSFLYVYVSLFISKLSFFLLVIIQLYMDFCFCIKSNTDTCPIRFYSLWVENLNISSFQLLPLRDYV